jgi:predicted RNA-binding Zn ribbon-like protein
VAFEFHADRLALDFAATLAERGTTDHEKLPRPEDFAAWAVEAGMVTEPPEVTARQLAAAINVREALYRVLSAALDGRAPAAEDRDLVNRAAASPRLVFQLLPSGTVTRTGTVGAVLAELACDCLDLLGSEQWTLLRRCSDPKCTRLFIDRSRGRRRRWCDMKGCGDRAKAAAYRQRHTSAPPAKVA